MGSSKLPLYIVVGQRKLRELPAFKWVNTVPGNLKTAISGAHKAFKFGKYATLYLGAFSKRFNPRFDLRRLVVRLIGDAAHAPPLRKWAFRGGAEVHAKSGGRLFWVPNQEARNRFAI